MRGIKTKEETQGSSVRAPPRSPVWWAPRIDELQAPKVNTIEKTWTSADTKVEKIVPQMAEGWSIWISQSTNPGTGLGEPQWGLPIQLEDFPPWRMHHRVTDLAVLKLYHCNNVTIIRRQHRNRNRNVNCNQSFKSHADRKVNKELTTLFGYDVLLKGISHVLRVQTQCNVPSWVVMTRKLYLLFWWQSKFYRFVGFFPQIF